ncbi:MAG: glycosyltransferase family 4 protein [Anaerolineae bacterium]|nr:glycosyltransferase family 4 protein [Anaerolineae bacterium]MCB9103377.1 glycosyltransferase family 4 protein [Anaerolineales bacterium]
MKVLMLSKACIVGAYQKKLEEMAAIDGVDLTVVVPPSWDDPRGPTRLEKLYTKGYELIVTDVVFNGNYHLHFYPKLRRIVRQVKPDIFHIDEEPYNLATFQAMRLAQSVNAGTVVFTWQNLLRRYPPPFSWMERYVLNRTDTLLVGNSEAADVWREKGYQGPIHHIPQFGVDPAIYYRRQRVTKKSKISVFKQRVARRPTQPALVIGYVGRLVEEKGLELLFLAASKLIGPWSLQVLGDGPDRKRFEQMVQWLGISPRVTFDHKLPSTHLPHYFSGLDVLVLPSLSRPNWKEQFGRVLIEAMACGVITIGARTGAIPEVIGDAGLTFKEGSVDELQACLQNLLDEVSLRESLRQKGRRRIEEKYTQAAIARNTVDVYRQIQGPGQSVSIGQSLPST